MKVKFIFFVTLKLFFHYNPKKGKLKFLSLPKFSIILVAFCIFTPLISLSITNGLQFFTIDTYKTLYSPYILNFGRILNSKVFSLPSLSTSYFQDYVILSNEQFHKTALLRAYSNEELSKLAIKNISTHLPLNENEVLIAQNMASSLHIKNGEILSISSIKNSQNMGIKDSQAIVKAIISFSNASLDSIIMITNKKSLESLLNISQYSINYLSSETRLPLKRVHQSLLGSSIKSFKELPPIKKILTEKTLLRFVLLSISFICFFAIFITLQTTFFNNIKKSAMLRVLGLKEKSVIFIFLLHGFIIGFLGILTGLLLTVMITPHIGSILSFIEYIVNQWGWVIKTYFPGIINSYWKFEIMPSSVFYITEPPIKMLLQDFILQVIIVTITVFFASILPSYKMNNQELINSLKNNN